MTEITDARNPATPPDQAETLGPAMQALTVKQRAFVRIYIENGGNRTEAAEKAGYSASTYELLKSAGSKLTHNSRILAAIDEETKSMPLEWRVKVLGEMMKIGMDVTAPVASRVTVLKHLATLGGMAPRTEHKRTIEFQQSEKQIIAEAKLLAKELGIDPRALLGQHGIVDAEFEIVDTTTGAEGLDDLL